MRYIYSLIAILALFGIIALMSAYAQEPIGKQVAIIRTVPDGIYQPFNTVARIRFGATTVVNPKGANDAAVVYQYEITAVVNAESASSVRQKLSSGELRLAKPIGQQGDKFEVAPSTRSIMIEILTDVERHPGTAQITRTEGMILSTQPTISGATHTGEMIAWEPKK